VLSTGALSPLPPSCPPLLYHCSCSLNMKLTMLAPRSLLHRLSVLDCSDTNSDVKFLQEQHAKALGSLQEEIDSLKVRPLLSLYSNPLLCSLIAALCRARRLGSDDLTVIVVERRRVPCLVCLSVGDHHSRRTHLLRTAERTSLWHYCEQRRGACSPRLVHRSAPTGREPRSSLQACHARFDRHKWGGRSN
jgi:hypothetical protein